MELAKSRNLMGPAAILTIVMAKMASKLKQRERAEDSCI